MMSPKEVQEQEPTSMREDFEKSISAIESDDDGAITTETEADAAELSAGDVNDDEEGKKAEAEAKTEAEAEKILAKKSGTEDKPDDDASKIGGSLQSVAGGTELESAPVSWTPAAREGWKDLPEPIRAQIAKRETEMDHALDSGKEYRKTGEKFQGIADRYAQVIAAEGAPDALTGVEELVKTVATLRMGSPEQKAQKIAGFIKHYGVSVDMLDGILSGQIGGKATNPNLDPNIESILTERLKPVNDLIARMDENTRQQNFVANQTAINEVATFKQDPKHEFYTDVQDDMADLVDMAGKRGITMPLQEAYDKACALSPEISGVLTKRADAARLLNGKQSLEEKKEAASSIMGQQGGEPAKDGKGMSMRDTITEAYDSQTG